MATDPAQIEAIFHDVLESPPNERVALIERACAGNQELRDRVEALLRSHNAAGSFMSATEDGPALRPAPQARYETEGSMIGPYKLLQQIGEGGFGSVFMAEQFKPIHRRVAIKIIKLGMDTRQVIARFEAERQALALMDHPNIAKVLDAGATDTGRPYFVMELVKGIPVTEYCDTNNLSLRQRLELFMPVCRAVQHAHQKGIIHRDIKPSNVLVTLHDGVPVPKVIDFGIAKATHSRLTDKTLFTEFRQFIGTPEYMSPEQAEMSGLDIDTRSDIYSLGVLLYELLTGTTPFDARQLRSAAYGEIQRIIREVEPPKPSTRVSTLGETLAATAAHRQIDARKFGQLMRGELDWIAMKCMEKDRTRRYENATSVAADIQHYLNDEPVEASPPSATYRLRKLARKYRRPLQAAALIGLLLIAATVFSVWQAVSATRAKAAALVEKRRADQEATTAKKITESLQQLLGTADPDAEKGPDYTVRQLLDDYADKLGDKLADEPEAEASLRRTIGMAYTRLGFGDKAVQHMARAVELRRELSGEQSAQFANALVDYAWAYIEIAHSQTSSSAQKQAEIYLRKALQIHRDQGVGGAPLIRALWYLEITLRDALQFDESERIANEALAAARQSPGVEYPEIASVYHGLVDVKIQQSNFPEAERLARESVAMHLRLQGPAHPETGFGYVYLGLALQKSKYAEALDAFRHALSVFQKSLPSNHWSIGTVAWNIDSTLKNAAASSALSKVFKSPGDLHEVESLLRKAVAQMPSLPNGISRSAVEITRALATLPSIYFKLGRELDADSRMQDAANSRKMAAELIENLQNQFAASPEQLGIVYSKSIDALNEERHPEQAKTIGHKLLASGTKDANVLNAAAWNFATDPNLDNRDPALAVELAKQALLQFPEDENLLNTLGVAEYRAGEWQRTVADLQKSVALRKEQDSCDWFFLAMAHWQLGDRQTAGKEYTQALTWMAKSQLNDAELVRFRDEAARLMGIRSTESPATTPSSTTPAVQ